MKNKLLRSSFYIAAPAAILGVAFIAGLWSYSRATGNEITVCAKRNGVVYVIGEGFKNTKCQKNETLLSWNIQGPPGPQGPQGELGPQGPPGPQGSPAPLGAGNVSFIHWDASAPFRVLTTDGVVWEWIGGAIGSWKQLSDDWPGINPPMPLANIVQWEVKYILDHDGNVWEYGSGSWKNIGHP